MEKDELSKMASTVTLEELYSNAPNVDDYLMELDNVIKTDELPPCTMVNVVATYHLGVRLNLKYMALLWYAPMKKKTILFLFSCHFSLSHLIIFFYL